MAKSLRGAAAAKLCHLRSSSFRVFRTIGTTKHSRGKSKQYHKSLALQLFSYKTFQDYLQHQDLFPPLNTAQMTKLKHLTIVSLAADRRILPYSDLLQALDISNVRELEDLIIDAIYLDLLHGKLDEKEEQLEVTYTMGRDLEPGKPEQISDALKDWASTTSAVLVTLDDKINLIAADTAATRLNQQEYERVFQKNLKEVYDKQKEKSLGGAMASRRGPVPQAERENMMMDVDEADTNGKIRKASHETVPKPSRKRNKF